MSWDKSWDGAVSRWHKGLRVMLPIAAVMIGIILAIAIAKQ